MGLREAVAADGVPRPSVVEVERTNKSTHVAGRRGASHVEQGSLEPGIRAWDSTSAIDANGRPPSTRARSSS